MRNEDALAFPLDGHDGMAFGLDDRQEFPCKDAELALSVNA